MRTENQAGRGLDMLLIKTTAGLQVMKDRSVPLTPRQRSAFILFDGRRSVAQVLEAAIGVGTDDVNQLIGLGLLEKATLAEALNEAAQGLDEDPYGSIWDDLPMATSVAAQDILVEAIEVELPGEPGFVPSQPDSGFVSTSMRLGLDEWLDSPIPDDSGRFKGAYAVATRLTERLGLRCRRLNLAVQACTDCDQLLVLLPKIRAVIGATKTELLIRALAG